VTAVLETQYRATERLSRGILEVTTMFDRFFGVPQTVIRSHTWAKMKPTEQSLYICLLHESELYCTRELLRTDAQMHELTELSSRSFCNARKKLQERGLFLCKRGVGNAYTYTLCNPDTGQPWPGDPKRPVAYVKKGSRPATSEKGPITSRDDSAKDPQRGYADQNGTSVKTDPEPKSEVHGIPLKF
jgi:hypothetical protein